MKFMLDTNTCIAIIKRRPAQVVRQFGKCKIGEIGVSGVTLSELHCGVAKSQHQAKNQSALIDFVSPLEIAPFDEPATATYGTLRAKLEKQGTPIGPLDTMIAAHALSLGATLVTNNRREFDLVVGLKVVDWVR